jgi:hypothetical protein
MKHPYRVPLPSIEVVRAAYPEQFGSLDALTSPAELKAFGVAARDLAPTSDAWQQVSRYAMIREIQSLVEVSATSLAGQYIEDCVAERLWFASHVLKGIDKTTKNLLRKYGFLGAMVNQLRPLAKVGKGNFVPLCKAELVDCSAEYCVWKWGREYVGQDLQDQLAFVADQNRFTKL